MNKDEGSKWYIDNEWMTMMNEWCYCWYKNIDEGTENIDDKHYDDDKGVTDDDIDDEVCDIDTIDVYEDDEKRRRWCRWYMVLMLYRWYRWWYM